MHTDLERKAKQWWSSISQISTKWRIISHLNWSHWTQRRLRHMTSKTQALGWDRHNSVAG